MQVLSGFYLGLRLEDMQSISDNATSVPLVDQVIPQIHGLMKCAQLVLYPMVQTLDRLHQTRGTIRDNHLLPAVTKPTRLRRASSPRVTSLKDVPT